MADYDITDQTIIYRKENWPQPSTFKKSSKIPFETRSWEYIGISFFLCRPILLVFRSGWNVLGIYWKVKARDIHKYLEKKKIITPNSILD
jgi:hypothetical protein